jgi:flavorubredoxin
MDVKKVLVDTVWEPFRDEFLANIRELIDPAEIDMVIVNHAETDHSGCLETIMERAKHAELVVSKRGAESVEGHYHRQWNCRTVKSGDTIPIGKNELAFIEAPMLHWPDSMFTFCAGENVLMPNDAFGQHYASGYRFNDEVSGEELFEEAFKYYVNILTPFSDQVIRKIDELTSADLPVEMIAPSHGIIWRENPLQIVHAYRTWASQEPEPRAVILFDTMWEATRKMAEAIGDGLAETGIEYRILRTAVTDRNDTLVDVFRSKAVIIGSPTLNNGVLPSIAPLLEDLRGLRFKNKIGAAFGSYGWSGESVKIIEEGFTRMRIPFIRSVSCRWQPGSGDLELCRSLGREIGEMINRKVSPERQMAASAR